MRRSVCWLLVGILIAIAIGRVAATYHVFNHTYDEPTHIYAGLQLLQTGDYSGHQETPPLARLLLAAGPHLYGVRAPAVASKSAALSVLYDPPSYETVLTLARLGNIPFLILLVVATALWTRHLFGTRAAVIAAATLTMLPPVLGHAGVATTDIACAATVLLALYFLQRWLEGGSWRSAILLALSGGVAVMVKFSAIPYLAVSAAAILLWRFLVFRETGAMPSFVRATAVQLPVMAAVVVCIVWLTYGFADPLRTAVIHDKFDYGDRQYAVARITGKDTAAFKVVRTVLSQIPFPVAAREIANGLFRLSTHNEKGHLNYLFGKTSRDGWWYFFLATLFFKTPIPFLLLAIFASIATVGRSIAERDWRLACPILGIVAVLMFTAAFSRINIGIRHILIVYPFAAIAIGGLVERLWTENRRALLAGTGALLLWLAGGSLVAHPDYLADFNAFAGDRPERFLIDSDLAWGQDLKRLRQAVADRKIKRIYLLWLGNADIRRHVPNAVLLKAGRVPAGWVAASRNVLATRPDLAWLDALHPVAQIGRSINLYYVDPKPAKDR